MFRFELSTSDDQALTYAKNFSANPTCRAIVPRARYLLETITPQASHT
jgi:hypothetical protein